MMTIEEFCEKNEAGREFKSWAKKYKSMKELWEKGDDYRKLVWVATRPKVMSDKELRLFACWCVRQVWQRLNDKNKKVVEVAERYAVGEASKKELEKASDAACGVANDAAWYVANDAAWYAALNSAREVVESGEKVSKDEVFEVIREAQVDYLRNKYTPKF